MPITANYTLQLFSHVTLLSLGIMGAVPPEDNMAVSVVMSTPLRKQYKKHGRDRWTGAAHLKSITFTTRAFPVVAGCAFFYLIGEHLSDQI